MPKRAIEDPGAARRLARAIVSDIVLYNDEALRAGRDLGAEIAEGRELFLSRVRSQHEPFFDEALADILLARWPGSRRVGNPLLRAEGASGHRGIASAKDADTEGLAPGLTPTQEPTSGSRLLLYAVLLLLALGLSAACLVRLCG